MTTDLDNLLKRLSQGEIGEEVARENFEYNKDLLLERLDLIDQICETAAWNSHKYIDHHSELLAYLAEGRKLGGYKKPASSRQPVE